MKQISELAEIGKFANALGILRQVFRIGALDPIAQYPGAFASSEDPYLLQT